ncbi:MAG: AAA family ATPase [Chloroflexi bacterium]|nr:AAA family ATPase [Chloroflexota bacterium]
MPSERLQRQVDRLLDEAEAAIAARDWPIVLDRARTALTLDPESADARAFLAAAERGLHAQAVPAQEAPAPTLVTGQASPPSAIAPAPFGPRAYTPPHLTERILRDRAALAGERKQVTVLFCDFANSTSLAERLGPEGMHTLLNRFFELALSEIHRYEGTVNQFLGDGFMALFGAPVAHEDHARRAVLAGLAIQRRVRDTWPDDDRPSLRMGLNTGPVVVGVIGDNLRMDYTAIGETTILAARMEQTAAPGAVQLAEATYRLVADYIACEPLGEVAVKGKVAPVPAWRALAEQGVRSRIEAAAARGLTPLVGRALELRALTGYWEQVQRGHGQVVLITGEAGLGKSRLLLEFRRSLGAGPRWLEGHSLSYGRGIPYVPIIDVLKGVFGIDESDGEERIVEKVERHIARWAEPARTAAPYLRFLLSIDPGDAAVRAMDPLERRAGIFDALRTLVQQESQELGQRAPDSGHVEEQTVGAQALVLVIEDLHWIDEQSEEALAALVDVVAGLPVLLLLTARPEYGHRLGERSYISRLGLSSLPADESAAIAAGSLGTDTLPAAVRRLIMSRAEGNPFYVEEVTRALVESGVLQPGADGYILTRPPDEVSVPDTIQGVILARIDRLAEEARRAIQLASVIGREFTARLLTRISEQGAGLDAALAELKALELVYETTYHPELAYMFKHALTHDAAYGTLLSERRKALHRLVAQAIEELYADRLPEQYETLAHHYERAEVWDKALEYLELAGDKAAAIYANRDALAYHGRAMVLCERQGTAGLSLLASISCKCGEVALGLGEIADAVTDTGRAIAAARKVGDRWLEGKAHNLLSVLEVTNKQFDRAEASARAALEIAESDGFDDLRVMAWVNLTILAAIVEHRFDVADRLMQAAEEVVSQVTDPWGPAWLGVMRILRSVWSGHFDDALGAVETWQRPMQNVLTTNVAGSWIEGWALAGQGRYESALGVLLNAISFCDRIGEVFARAKIVNTIGWIYAEVENHTTAYEWNARGVEDALALGFPDAEIESNARINLGLNLTALGRLDEAGEQFRQVERVVRDPNPELRWAKWRYSQRLFVGYGELWLVRGDLERALTLATECLALADETESRKYIIVARRLRAAVYLAQSDHAAAQRELDLALPLARDLGSPPQIWKTLVVQGELRTAQGRQEESRAVYDEALAVIDGVAAGLTDQVLRTTFLDSPHVQAIRLAADVR